MLPEYILHGLWIDYSGCFNPTLSTTSFLRRRAADICLSAGRERVAFFLNPSRHSNHPGQQGCFSSNAKSTLYLPTHPRYNKLMTPKLKPLVWENHTLRLLDQRLLPHTQQYIAAATLRDCCQAIKNMVVRGAPLIGFTAVWALALWLKNHPDAAPGALAEAASELKAARPTAVNLAYEVDRILRLAEKWQTAHGSLAGLFPEVVRHTKQQMTRLAEHNLQMARFMEKELTTRLPDKKLNLMTICNTGTLACGCLGTALGAIQHLASSGRVQHVYVSETRPYLQGSRLTSFELLSEGISHEIVVDGAAAYLLGRSRVDAVLAGADRITACGDTANKIGTAALSIIARYYNVPFYIVAPASSFDPVTADGAGITIELRDPAEILSCQGTRTAPDGARALNPSFDITPAANITAIVCEQGIISPVTGERIRDILNLEFFMKQTSTNSI